MASGRLSADRRRLLDRLLEEGPAARALPRITAADLDRRRLPLSFAQRRIWFLDRLEPGSALYNMVGGARLSGTLHPEPLRRSLTELVMRHETLRTTFHHDAGGPWARVRPDAEVDLRIVDLSGLPQEARRAAVAEHRRREANRPFDLERDLMLRALLLRLAPDDHLLVVCLHHIAADGWSLTVLFGELTELYRAYAAGAAPSLPRPDLQYADFAEWQRRHLAGPVLREHLDHWVTGLAGAPLLELPTDRPRPGRESSAGATLEFALPAGLVAALRDLGDREHATPYMVLLAGFAVLLHRWSGQDDLVVGASAACRDRTELTGVVGCFVNLLPLRLDTSGEPTFRELLRRVRRTCLDGYAHQDAPFEQVVEELAPRRQGSRTPLVRHSLVVHEEPGPRVRLPGLDVEVMPVFTDTAKFELKLELTPDGTGGLTGVAEYAVALYDRATVRRLTGCLRELLADAAADPDRPIGELRLVDRAERDRLLRVGDRGPDGARDEACLHELFEAVVRRTPQAVAVVDGATQMTYAELDERADRVAWLLREAGVGPEEPVAVCLRRSAELLAVMLGVLKAGAVLVPLDPAYPRERLDFMIADSGARVLLTRPSSGLVDTPGEGPQILVPDERTLALARPPHGRRPSADARWAAYMIYTSGSTGRPKGVVCEHRALVNRVRVMREDYGLRADDAALWKTPLGFDVSVGEWALPLTTGARVVVAPGLEDHRDPARLVRLLRDEACTTINVVPSLLGLLLDEPGLAECTALRRVLSGGEELAPDLARRLRAALPGTTLINLYGPTEAAIDVTTWQVGEVDGARIPIGRPIPGAHLYVLDDHMAPVPIGMPGELHIGGLPLARGYHGRPALTAERFVPDPFGTGGRLYRTGDVVRWLDGGVLEFLGRLDHQVKIRGQRIEPGEIEAVLGDDPAVTRAVVVARPDAAGGARLVAYLGLAGTADAGETVREARARIAARLPAPMVPSRLVVVEEWPAGPTGKLDRTALPDPGEAAVASAGNATGPAPTETERLVLELWRELLAVDRIGVHDDFFQLGGHSLLAARLVAMVRTRFGVTLPLAVLLRTPTVAGVAAHIDGAGPADAVPASIPRAKRRPVG